MHKTDARNILSGEILLKSITEISSIEKTQPRVQRVVSAYSKALFHSKERLSSFYILNASDMSDWKSYRYFRAFILFAFQFNAAIVFFNNLL